jgi:hypothetical protein
VILPLIYIFTLGDQILLAIITYPQITKDWLPMGWDTDELQRQLLFLNGLLLLIGFAFASVTRCLGATVASVPNASAHI